MYSVLVFFFSFIRKFFCVVNLNPLIGNDVNCTGKVKILIIKLIWNFKKLRIYLKRMKQMCIHTYTDKYYNWGEIKLR